MVGIIVKLKMRKYLRFIRFFKSSVYLVAEVGTDVVEFELIPYRIVKIGFFSGAISKYPKELFTICHDKYEALKVFNMSSDKKVRSFARFRCLSLSELEKIKIYRI